MDVLLLLDADVLLLLDVHVWLLLDVLVLLLLDARLLLLDGWVVISPVINIHVQLRCVVTTLLKVA